MLHPKDYVEKIYLELFVKLKRSLGSTFNDWQIFSIISKEGDANPLSIRLIYSIEQLTNSAS
jgi:hypothetical protein